VIGQARIGVRFYQYFSFSVDPRIVRCVGGVDCRRFHEIGTQLQLHRHKCSL